MRPARLLVAAALAALAAGPGGAGAIEVTSPEGELFAFPSLQDDAGRPIADSTMRQWFERGLLHVRIEHAFADGRRAVERARFRQGRDLAQEAWSWEERRGDQVVRAFDVDLEHGVATGRKVGDDGKVETWREDVKVEEALTFVGIGVPYAVKNLRDSVLAGHRPDLRTIVFLPKPISVPIFVKDAGRERITVERHEVDADKLEVRPDLHGLEKVLELFKDPAGADVWVHHGTPPMLLRVRYPLVEVRDPVVRIDTLGGKYAPPRAAARRAPPAGGARDAPSP